MCLLIVNINYIQKYLNIDNKFKNNCKKLNDELNYCIDINSFVKILISYKVGRVPSLYYIDLFL